MFRIGDFSRIARVSMRLLRYYDELGLIRPAHTDARNGYRYYTAAQLPELNRILVLRDLGLTLEQIAQALQARVSADELRGMLLMRRAEIEQQQAEQALQLRLLESRISALESGTEGLPDDVVIRAEPERLYVSLRGRYPSFASALATALVLSREVPRQLGREGLGALIGVSHSAEFEPDDIDVELGFALDAEPAELPRVGGQKLTLRTLPSHERVATCVRVGSPVHAHLATAHIARHLEATGYQLAGPNRETFLQPPIEGKIDQAVVEMAYPIAQRA